MDDTIVDMFFWPIQFDWDIWIWDLVENLSVKAEVFCQNLVDAIKQMLTKGKGRENRAQPNIS